MALQHVHIYCSRQPIQPTLCQSSCALSSSLTNLLSFSLSLTCLSVSYQPSLSSSLSFTPPASSSFLDLLTVLQWNAAGLRAESVEFLHFFCSILSILSVSRNLVSTLVYLLGSLDILLCDLFSPISGLALFTS